LSGLGVFQNATRTPDGSVAHIVLRSTQVEYVVAASRFITKSHPVGGVVSTIVETEIENNL
jgi:hypothetical protein